MKNKRNEQKIEKVFLFFFIFNVVVVFQHPLGENKHHTLMREEIILTHLHEEVNFV